MKYSLILSLTVAGMLFSNVSGMAQSNDTKENQLKVANKYLSPATMDFKISMRALWENESQLTYNVILCIVDDKPGIDEAKGLLIKNQVAIGNIFALYYGNDAGKKITELLNKNTAITVDIMIATLNESDGAYMKAYKAWKENTSGILCLFNLYNPNWNLDNVKTMMYTQIQYIANEATDVKDKNFQSYSKTYSSALQSELTMANSFSDGIIQQFPGKFPQTTLAVAQK